MQAVILVVAIACAAVLAQHRAPPPEVLKIMEDCRKEFNLDEQAVRTKQVPADKKCFFKCMGTKLGHMDAAGNVLSAAFKAKLQRENAPQDMINRVDQCANVKMADPCDTAEALAKCMHPPQ